MQTLTRAFDFMHRHLADRFQRQPGVVPRRHSAHKVAGEPGVPGADKIADDVIELLVGLQDQEDRFLGIQQPARPNGEQRLAADAERPFDMPAAKGQHHAGVNQHAVLALDCLLEQFGGQPAYLGEVTEDLRAFRVYLLHPGIVSRRRRRGGEGIVGEAFDLIKLQELVEAPLMANGAAEPVTDVGTARRTRPMPRIDNDPIVQLQVKLTQGVKEPFGQSLRLSASEQIGASGGTDKKRITAEHAPRRVRMVLLGDQIGDVFRRVAGRVPNRDQGGTELESVSVMDGLVVKAVARPAFVAEEDVRGFDPRREFARAADQIRVDVGLKNVRDGNLLLAGEFEVAVHVSTGIDERSNARGVIPDQI